jgi:glycosyltransferase involved in cell wall biosynthesis
MSLIVGVDASRNRSGGAKAHLIGILGDGDPLKHGIREVHVWAFKTLLDSLPDKPWLVKHNPKALERSLFRQVWWQRRVLPKEAREAGCTVFLNTDAGTVCRFRPAVTISRDMLSYEPGEIQRYGLSKARLRLILLRYMQDQSLRMSDGVIFLTKHAANVIQKSSGKLARIALIPHGVGSEFKQQTPSRPWPTSGSRPIRCLYVSNAAMYKHQWMVVRAIAALRKRGHDLKLTLTGGGDGRAQRLLDDAIAVSDPSRSFVELLGFVPPKELPRLLAEADLFVFASSCENMPNTLVEAMAVGLPIACSNRGPMPEVLAEGGVYFDPEDADSIAAAIEKIIVNEDLRLSVAKRAKMLSEQYSWARCAAETWDFVRVVATG